MTRFICLILICNLLTDLIDNIEPMPFSPFVYIYVCLLSYNAIVLVGVPPNLFRMRSTKQTVYDMTVKKRNPASTRIEPPSSNT
jgi:hypothetical protein